MSSNNTPAAAPRGADREGEQQQLQQQQHPATGSGGEEERAAPGAGEEVDPAKMGAALLEMASSMAAFRTYVEQQMAELRKDQADGAEGTDQKLAGLEEKRRLEITQLKDSLKLMEEAVMLALDLRGYWRAFTQGYTQLERALELLKKGDVEATKLAIMDGLMAAATGMSTVMAVAKQGLYPDVADVYTQKLLGIAVDDRDKDDTDPKWRDPKVVRTPQQSIIKAANDTRRAATTPNPAPSGHPRTPTSTRPPPGKPGSGRSYSKGEDYRERDHRTSYYSHQRSEAGSSKRQRA